MVVDHHDLLDRPFAEGAVVADDQAAAVITDHAREDLGRTGAELVDQDDERAVPGRPFVIVVEMLDAEDFLDLHDRASVDEQSREGLGFLEQPAAVAPQVEDDCVDAACLEVVQDLAAVARGADGVAIAPEDRHRVAIERRQVDDADLESLAVGCLGLDDLALGMLLGELDLLAGDLVDPLLLGAVRLNDQPTLVPRGPRMWRTTSLSFFSTRSMTSPSSFSMPMILSSGWSRPSLSAAMSGTISVTTAKPSSDRSDAPIPSRRKVELLIEHVLEVLGPQVRGVRVERLGQARQVDLHQLAGVDLVSLAVAVAIADRPLAHRFGFIDVVDDLGEEQVELDLLAQPLVGFRLVDRDSRSCRGRRSGTRRP